MKTVCITQLDDGSFNVELEPAETEDSPQSPNGTTGEMPEMPEGSPEEMTSDMQEGEPSQTYASIDEALDVARGMFDGQEDGPTMDGEKELQDSFVSGFKNARGVNGGF